MVFTSPFTTPSTGDTLRIKIVDTATPWPEISLRKWRTTTTTKPPSIFDPRPHHVTKSSYRLGSRALNKTLCLMILLISLLWFALGRGKQSINFEFRRKVEKTETDGLKFVDATHPYIRYVGRWVSSPDGGQKDGSFPGVYFDIVLNGSTTLLLSLRNSIKNSSIAKDPPALSLVPSFNSSTAKPISLLARIDDDEYHILPNATSLVAICKGSLDPGSKHEIRIIAPMTGGNNVETFQFEGLWISEGGQLLPLDSDGQNHMSTIGKYGGVIDGDIAKYISPPRKMLEIVTDIFGSMAGRDRRSHATDISTTRNVLGGVMGWEYLIGDMFGADHAITGMQGMCLIQGCIGGRGSPAGLADVFFQSGPLGSDHWTEPWHFQAYLPDVIVMNIGNSDWESFQMYNEKYNKTIWELSVLFEDTYVSLIKAVRTLAYPKYSSSLLDTRYSTYSPSDIPIFVMRPFRGQLEQATHSVVDRLQNEGDKSTFWLDTSGWLNTDIDFERRPEDQDFFLDEESPTKEWRLTERANQRVAILLHMHVCRYLAQDVDKCAFLPPEVYQGEVIDPEIMTFDLLKDRRS